MKVHASGLAAAAERLRAAAAQLVAGGPSVHPPLAADQTSIAAAARLTAGARQLQSVTNVQAAALISTAGHLATLAVRFTEQEARNAAAVENLASANQPSGSPGALAAVPPVPADSRLPLPLPGGGDAEVVARQLYAGTASAGQGFAQCWHSRSAAAVGARDVIRAVVPSLADLWNSPAGTAAATARLLGHAHTVTTIADRAAELANQAERHAQRYGDAVASTPAPAAFEAILAQLRQALEADARLAGRFTPLVSSLIAQQGRLRQQALNAQTRYHEETDAMTRPEGAGETASQLPGTVPDLLGAIGGLAGGAVAAAAQLPQTLTQTGQQLALSVVQGMSGLANSSAGEIDTATTGFKPQSNGRAVTGDPQAGVGATSPSGAVDSAPVAQSTSSAPPSTIAAPQGVLSAGTAPAAGLAAVPMGMPLGMLAPPLTDTTQQVAADKKIIIPPLPHAESVTGRTSPGRLTHHRVAVRMGRGETT